MKTSWISLVFVAAGLAVAGDWPEFRGPLGNAVSDDPGLPTTLSARNIQWAVDLPGEGVSSPILVGDRVFVTCSSGPRQDRLHVVCFNAADGSRRWERQFWATGRTMCHEKTAVAAPTPASDGERLFAFFSSNDLLCLDLDGNLLWLRGLTRDYPNASNSIGMSSSLTTADGVVVVMVENDSESFTAGIDVRTGTNCWKLARPKLANWTSPFVLRPMSGPATVVLQSGKGVVAVEARTGRQLWEYTDGASTIPSAAYSDGVLYVPSRGLTALQPSAPGQPPKQLWRSSLLRPSTPSPVVVGDRVFTLNEAGVLTCGSTAGGERLWQLRLQGPISATPVAAGPMLYCVSEKGLLQVVDSAQPDGAVVGTLDLGQMILSTPSVSRGALYLRSDTRLWKLAAAR